MFLGCECGEPGCWPLMAHITVRDQEVLGGSFEQPHRRDKWTYDDFDRSQYEAALAHAQETTPDGPC